MAREYASGRYDDIHALDPACVFNFSPIDEEHADNLDFSLYCDGTINDGDDMGPSDIPEGATVMTAEDFMKMMSQAVVEKEEEKD